ncbi:MAG: hypothetical protein Q9174_004147 [Haloplaca sp. 1 TL-2023]
MADALPTLPKPKLPSPRIAIIGAGPAGLTLARLLTISSQRYDVTVYESDTNPSSRGQGGTLDLHTSTGLAAIKKCHIWDSFQTHARYSGSELNFADKNATELIHLRGSEKRDRPEIDRHRLREILLASIPAGDVRWGHRLKEVTEDGRLRFEGRDEEQEEEGPFDLIVGADGGWSKVRNRLTSTKPTYSGISGYELDLPSPATRCPVLNNFVGQGAYFSSSDQKLLNAQRMGDGSLKIRSWFLCPDEFEARESLDRDGKEGTLQRIRERYREWAPEILQFLEMADVGTLRCWTVYELPVGGFWEHRKGFTLVGDAASLAAPFSGEGVNKAMRDSLELAEALCEAWEKPGRGEGEEKEDVDMKVSLDEAVKMYEENMFPRAEKLQRLTARNKEAMFAPDAPVGMFGRMIETMKGEEPSLAMRVLGSGVVVKMVNAYFWLRVQVGWVVRRWWRRN